MKVDRDLVHHIARLARLELTEQEIELFTTQLQTIVQYVEKLNEIEDTAGESIMTQEQSLQTREDSVIPSLPVEQVTENAPDQKRNLFRVPRVIR